MGMLFLSTFVSHFHLQLQSNLKRKLFPITFVLYAFIDHLLFAKHCAKPWKNEDEEEESYFKELKGKICNSKTCRKRECSWHSTRVVRKLVRELIPNF